MLEDTWLLRMTLSTDIQAKDPLTLKWERRKKPASYAPSLRSGCTMALWAAKGMGVLFGGVSDEDRDEETLDSVFWNDLWVAILWGGNMGGNGIMLIDMVPVGMDIN